jgi:mxaD protein
MRRYLLIAVFALLGAPLGTYAQGVLNVSQTVDIGAPATEVWNSIDWNAMHGWHPAFASTELLSGENNTPGSVRRLTIKDGPVFDEELLAYDRQTMRLRYKIIGENALPLTNYESTLQVTPLGATGCFVVWRGSFVAKPDADPNLVMREIAGLYRMGLDHLKQLVERGR